MKSLAWLLHDEKKKGVQRMTAVGGNDILKSDMNYCVHLEKRYKRLKVQVVSVNNQWQMDLADITVVRDIFL